MGADGAGVEGVSGGVGVGGDEFPPFVGPAPSVGVGEDGLLEDAIDVAGEGGGGIGMVGVGGEVGGINPGWGDAMVVAARVGEAEAEDDGGIGFEGEGAGDGGGGDGEAEEVDEDAAFGEEDVLVEDEGDFSFFAKFFENAAGGAGAGDDLLSGDFALFDEVAVDLGIFEGVGDAGQGNAPGAEGEADGFPASHVGGDAEGAAGFEEGVVAGIHGDPALEAGVAVAGEPEGVEDGEGEGLEGANKEGVFLAGGEGVAVDEVEVGAADTALFGAEEVGGAAKEAGEVDDGGAGEAGEDSEGEGCGGDFEGFAELPHEVGGFAVRRWVVHGRWRSGWRLRWVGKT